MKKVTLSQSNRTIGSKNNRGQHFLADTRGKTWRLFALLLLLLPFSLLLSACANATQAATPVAATPIQSDDASVYILARSDGSPTYTGVSKLDAKTHKLLWHAQPTIPNVTSVISNAQLTIAGDHIYISFYASFGLKISKHFVYALSSKDGKELWHTEFEGYTQKDEKDPTGLNDINSFGWLTDPVADTETVYVASSVGKVYALNASDGSIRWTYDTKMTGVFCPTADGKQLICTSWSRDYFGVRQLTIDHGVLYGGIKNRFYALDAAKGTALWSHDLPADQNINQPVAIDGKLAYVVACSPLDDCFINAYTADKGSTAWRTAEPRHRLEPLTIENHIIYAISESNMNTAIPGVGVYAWNAMNGKQLWHYEAPKSTIIGSPKPILVANDQVYISLLSFEKTYMYTRLAFNAGTGAISWQTPKTPEDSNLLTTSDHAIYAGVLNTLFAYSTTDGSKIWQYALPPVAGDTDALRILDVAEV